ncbi:MAG: peptidylprolyl isomerase [Deltaproteobacteria bacterium]
MAGAKDGDKVRVHYTGKVEDGTVFDSSKNRDPLEFTLGESGIIPGFQEMVVGMNPGDSKTDTIPSEKAYGPYVEEMVLEVERDKFPEDLDPEVGQHLQLSRSDGQVIPVLITRVDESTITLDANHPLAGKDLTFEVDLVEIL